MVAARIGRREMTDVRAACKDWVTGYGTSAREDIPEIFAETTDQELSEEMLDGWFSEPDPHDEVYGPNGPPTVEAAIAMFADLRADLSWLDDWNLPKRG